jgi:hypothetical protein
MPSVVDIFDGKLAIVKLLMTLQLELLAIENG